MLVIGMNDHECEIITVSDSLADFFANLEKKNHKNKKKNVV